MNHSLQPNHNPNCFLLQTHRQEKCNHILIKFETAKDCHSLHFLSYPFDKEAQKRYREKQAQKEAVRRVLANFDERDHWVTLTYSPSMAPHSYKESKKNLVNYIRRVKRKRASLLKTICNKLAKNPETKSLLEKKALLERPFKYCYVIEESTFKSGVLKGDGSWHIHIFMSAGLSREEMIAIWTKGEIIEVDYFKPEIYGPESAARYMMKDPKGQKRFVCSRNISKPIKKKPRDGAITRRGLERLIKDGIHDSTTYWEKRCKGYYFLRSEARYNSYKEK